MLRGFVWHEAMLHWHEMLHLSRLGHCALKLHGMLTRAAAATLTAFARASLARTGDKNRRAVLPCPRASVANRRTSEAPFGLLCIQHATGPSRPASRRPHLARQVAPPKLRLPLCLPWRVLHPRGPATSLIELLRCHLALVPWQPSEKSGAPRHTLLVCQSTYCLLVKGAVNTFFV